MDCSTAVLYSSYNNPYPGSAYYELTSVATTTRPVVIGVGSKGKPLYIAVSGSRLETGDDRRCSATLGPVKHESKKEYFVLYLFNYFNYFLVIYLFILRRKRLSLFQRWPLFFCCFFLRHSHVRLESMILNVIVLDVLSFLGNSLKKTMPRTALLFGS